MPELCLFSIKYIVYKQRRKRILMISGHLMGVIMLDVLTLNSLYLDE